MLGHDVVVVGAQIEGTLIVPDGKDAWVEDCTIIGRPAERRRRWMPRWLHRQLFRLVTDANTMGIIYYLKESRHG